MRALQLALLVALLLANCCTLRAAAQSDVGPPLGTLYVSSLPDEYRMFSLPPPLFSPFDIYVGVNIDFADIGAPEQNAFNGIRAYEFGISSPAPLIIVGADWEGEINLGQSNLDYIVGVGVPFVVASSTPRWLVHLVGLYVSYGGAGYMEVALASTQTVPGKVVWQEEYRGNGCTHRLTGAPERCFFPFAELLSLCVTPGCFGATETSSWGTLKQDFRSQLPR